MNLIARGGPGDQVVLLDWAFTGAGAVGEDVGNLIPDSVADGLIDPRLLPEIDQAVTGGYLAWLRAGGWRGQDAQVRRAVTVTGAAKYCWLAPRMLQRLAGGGGPGFYDRRGDEQVLAGRLGTLTLVATWGRLALGEAAGYRPPRPRSSLNSSPVPISSTPWGSAGRRCGRSPRSRCSCAGGS